MIWLNPWAWAGAAAVVLPVLIHLLGRGHARVYRFPTLRFLAASRLLPTRRTRIHDAALLVVRCAILVLAAAALAHPLWMTPGRRQSLDRGLARAIVVDTSASMRRLTPAGTSAMDSARTAARTLAAAAQTSVIIESNDPARAFTGAAAWLAREQRRAELVVISDFQRGQIDSTDLASVPPGIGVTLDLIPTTSPSSLESQSSIGGFRVGARTTIAGDQSAAEWTATGSSAALGNVSLLGADSSRAALSATQDAAATVATALPVDSTRGITIVFPKYADAARLRSTTRAVDAPWMLDLLARLQVDSLPVISAGIGSVGRTQQLMLFTSSLPGTFTAARLVAAVNTATSIAPSVNELEPAAMPDAELLALQRAAANDIVAQQHATGDNGPSDARWLWIAALILLGVETLLRRDRAKAVASPNTERARAA